MAVDADDGGDVAHRVEHRIERDQGQRGREHLDDEKRIQQRGAADEADAAEGIGGDRRDSEYAGGGNQGDLDGVPHPQKNRIGRLDHGAVCAGVFKPEGQIPVFERGIARDQVAGGEVAFAEGD